jgi:hypothetical protein
VKHQGSIIFWTDVAIFLLFTTLAVTGFLERWSSWDVADLHFWLSIPLILLIVFHLALHWRWIRTNIGRRLPGRSAGGTRS